MKQLLYFTIFFIFFTSTLSAMKTDYFIDYDEFDAIADIPTADAQTSEESLEFCSNSFLKKLYKTANQRHNKQPSLADKQLMNKIEALLVDRLIIAERSLESDMKKHKREKKLATRLKEGLYIAFKEIDHSNRTLFKYVLKKT